MSLGLVLTIIFLVLQYGVHAIDWELWQLFLPVMVELGLCALWFVVVAGLAAIGLRR